MDHCDALVVGGGPAGSACAGRLRQAGWDALVVDKARFPRDKTCAGWITPAIIDELDLDVNDYRREHVFQPITAFRTGMIGGPLIRTGYREPVSYGIRRCEFDHYLLQRSGARLRLGEPIRKLEREGEGWVVNESIHTPLLIGAGGHFCPVARMLSPEMAPVALVVVAQEIEFRMTDQDSKECQVEPEVPELYFCHDLKGYGWCFRKGEYLNIGLGRTDRDGLSAHVVAFCDSLKSLGRIPKSLPEGFHGHAYLLYEQKARRLTDDGVLLVGDAAGLAYSQSGEGIRPAIESGLLAAEIVVEAAGDYRQETLRRYEHELTERFGRQRTASPVLPPFVDRWKQRAAARLLANRWFTRRVVLDRWFLHRTVPPLVFKTPSDGKQPVPVGAKHP